MRTSVLRQAAASRVALVARPAFRLSSAPLALSRSASRTASPVYRPASALLRFYSSESAASEQRSGNASGLVTRFEDLSQLGVNERLVHAITQEMRYENMTDVQSMTINPALAGKDVVAQAKTGTGKTLAFLVPIVQRIISVQPELARPRGGSRPSADDIRAIIVSPTRELAEQIGAEAKRLCRGTGVIIQTAVGGTQKNMMLRKTRFEGCHLLVATPGRLQDLLSDPTSGIAAPRLAALVLDEADRMLDVGFKAELESILRYLPERSEVPRQTLLYSATLPKNVVGLARQFINPTNFEFVQTVKADEVPTHERVPQFIVPCRGFENLAPSLVELIRREDAKGRSGEGPPFKAIVFLPTTASVVYYATLFRRLRYEDRSIPRIYDIHSKLQQGSRTRSANDFRASDSAILFSSDVSARGMDFPGVSHVVQVHLPQDRDLYIHRIGRTGRAGKEGKAYLIVSDVEVPSARDLLPGLPIQRSTDLQAASVDVSKGENPLEALFDEVRNAASKAPYEVLRDTYTSYLGGAMRSVDKQDVVNEINNLAKHTWGLDEPPAVSPSVVRQLGGRIRGIRVADSPSSRFGGAGRDGGDRDGFGRGGFGGGRGGFGGGRGGFGGGRDRRPRDGFEVMEDLAREERGGRRQRPPPPSF